MTNGVKGRLGVEIRIDYEGIISSDDTVTVVLFGSVSSTSGQKLPQKTLPSTCDVWWAGFYPLLPLCPSEP